MANRNAIYIWDPQYKVLPQNYQQALEMAEKYATVLEEPSDRLKRFAQDMAKYAASHQDELEEEVFIQQITQQLIRMQLVESVHDISDGGLFANLLESAMPRGLGFSVRTTPGIRKDACLFGEAQSRVVVSVRTEQVEAFERFLQSENAPFQILGEVRGHTVSVDGEEWGEVAAWERTYSTVLTETMSE